LQLGIFEIGQALSAFGQSYFKIRRARSGALRLCPGASQRRKRAMTHRRTILIFATTTALGALVFAAARAHDVPKVATGFVASVVCSETFVSALDPNKIFAETTAAMPGAGLISWALDTRVDRARHDVTVTLAGFAESHAVYRGELGCVLDHGGAIIDAATPAAEAKLPPALLADIAGPSVVAPQTQELAAALDHAFAEPANGPPRRTKAIVIVKDGRIVAERYADGYGIDTPILGFSEAKSVTSALIGILVRQGKLALDKPAPVAAWQDPRDPRHTITIDQLLRHTAGLALGSSLQASLASALEPINRMKYIERDQAAFAEAAALETKPGSAWNYHDGNYLILSQLIGNAVGGNPSDVLRFARSELFGPLGMRHVTLEFDGAGTFEGATQMLAPARDWARFGLLYLNDGIVGSKRILPEGWVGYSASPTPNAFVGYGAGFWTNLGDSFGANYRIAHGWPGDAFFAKGTIGQYVIVIPAQRLVIARFGKTPNWPLDADGVSDLVRDVIAATGDKAKLARGN
jgi:CubicO group peptidase (beta-lactamase class C family)